MYIGSKAMIKQSNDNENYDAYRGKVLIVTHVAKNTYQHPGYDSSMNGMALYDFKTEDGENVPFSLYEYEVRSIGGFHNE